MAKAKVFRGGDLPALKSRKRKLLQERSEYLIMGINRESEKEEQLATASNSAAALATCQLAQSLGKKTHKDFFIRKISTMSMPENGEV